MKLLIDAMSTDHSPDVLLAGIAAVAKESSIPMAIIGDPSLLTERAIAIGLNLQQERFTLVPASQVVSMSDEALCVVKDKSDSSMAVGLRLLAEGKGDAFISAGNTGALLAGASLIVRRIKGIGRAAIGGILPLSHPTLLLDCGAHTDIKAEHLVQYARMGTAYLKKLYGLQTVRIGLINNGTEAHKGAPLQKEAYALLSACPDLHFYGNVEGNDLFTCPCDLLLTDGFTGNVILKLLEGVGAQIKAAFPQKKRRFPFGKQKKEAIDSVLTALDPHFFGGAPLLGISRPVIKAHGASDAQSFAAAIRCAIRYMHANPIPDIARACTEQGTQSQQGETPS